MADVSVHPSSPVGLIRQLASVLTSRGWLSSAAGKSFNGDRDLYEALGYDVTLDINKFWARYQRGDVAGRIVDTYPDETWRGRVELIENDDPETLTPFEEAWLELDYRLNVTAVLHRADKLSGIGEYAGILLGAPGVLEAPLTRLSNPEALVFLAPYSQLNLSIRTFEAGITDSRYGFPDTYNLKTHKIGAQAGRPESMVERVVHWTRIIHISDGLLDNEVVGTPRLQRPWNRLDDLDKIVGAGAEAFWRRADPGVQFNLDKDFAFKPGEESKMSDEVEEYMHGLRRYMRTQGMDIKVLDAQTAEFKGNVEAVMQLISAATKIPVRILMGSERGELASTEDRDNFSDAVHTRQTTYAEPFLLRRAVTRFIELGVLPEPEDDYEVRWPTREPTEGDRADLADKYAGINQKNGDIVLTADEIRDRAFGLEPLTDEERGLNAEEEREAQVEEGAEDEAEGLSRAAGRHRTMLDKRRKWWRTRKARKRDIINRPRSGVPAP